MSLNKEGLEKWTIKHSCKNAQTPCVLFFSNEEDDDGGGGGDNDGKRIPTQPGAYIKGIL